MNSRRAVLIFLFGVLIALPANLYPALQRIEGTPSPLDKSWQLELPMRLAQGELSGRDFIFTYGPLYQLTHALGLVVPGGDLASVLRFYMLPEVLLALLCVWLLLGFTEAPLAWRAGAYLLWAIFWPPLGTPPAYAQWPSGLKPLAGLLLVAAAGRCLARRVGEARRGTRAAATPWLVWGLCAPLVMLYAFDVGVMTLLALALALALTCALTWISGSPLLTHPLTHRAASASRRDAAPSALRQDALSGAAAATLGVALFVALCTLVPGWGNYLPDSWRLVAGYSYVMASPGTVEDFVKLAAAGVATCAGLLLAWRHVRASLRQGLAGAHSAEGAHRSLALLAGLAFCLVWLRYGLTRSNSGAIQLALVPALFMAGCFLPCYLRARGETNGARLAWLAAIPLVALSPFGVTAPAQAWRRATAVSNLELRAAYLLIEDRNMREAAAVARQLTAPMLYVWPHSTLVNLIARKPSPAYTVQSYVATAPALEDATIERLQRVPETPVMVLTKDWPVDGVENLTRTPRLFRYLLENYELDGPPHASFFLLRPRGQTTGTWREWPMTDDPISFAPDIPHGVEFACGGDCRASDMFVLALRAACTPLYAVGKPGRLSVTFVLSGGEEQTRVILLPPDGEAHDVLVNALPTDAPLFATQFSPTRQWRSRERVVSVRLNWSRLDILSRPPQDITLARLSVLRRDGVEVLETPLSEQGSAASRDWCFEEERP